MKKQWIKKKVNNSGAALVSVVIVIAFVSVLVTTVLYMAGMNYYSKATDRETKQSFYEAEIPLEMIKAELMKEAKTAHQKAFEATLPYCASSGEGERRATYYSSFTNKLKEQLETKVTNKGTLEGYLDSIVGTAYSADLKVASTGGLDFTEMHKGRIYIRGIEMTHIKDGFQTMIKTDVCILAPELAWGADAAAPDFDVADSTTNKRKKIDMSDCVLYYNWRKE